MSFHVFFAFSEGLSETLRVPKGTAANAIAHVEEVERTLGLKRSKYKDNPVHWDHWDKQWRAGFPKVDDKVLCETVEDHNKWVQRLYWLFGEWAKNPVEDGEDLTPEIAATFWHGLQELKVRPERWTGDYYRARMDDLYEVMRGRKAAGMSFDTKALTTKQAAAVIRIFDQYLDPDDYRLDVPDGYDYLASSYDGGYSWCDKCFKPKHPDDYGCRRKGCPLTEDAI